MRTDYDLEERLIAFSVSIINFLEKVPRNDLGKYFGNQLLRSSSSPALNYGEAQAAESDRDFVHKLRICLKELRETQINLKILARGKWISDAPIEELLNECSQLVAIFTTSVKTAEKRLNRK